MHGGKTIQMQPLARVLIVDDDPMMLELVSTRLDLAGFETMRARNGHEGLNRLRDHSFNAMILDLNMPSLSGLDVLKQMKALGYLPRVPTMMLTASHQANDVRLAIQSGASDFLGKPFEDHVLLSRVARLVRRSTAPANLSATLAAPRAPSRHVW